VAPLVCEQYQSNAMTIPEALAYAVQCYQAGNIRQAEQICQQILQADPANADAHHLLGVLACQSKDRLDEAITHFRQALQIRPGYYQALNNLGNAFYLKDNLEQAVFHYRQALNLGPNYPDAYCNLGNVLLRQEKFDDAIRSYQQALRLKPDAADVWNNMGLALQRQNKLDEAGRCFQQAVQINARYTDAHTNLGNVLLRQEKLDEAIRSYQQALRLNPNSPQVCNSMGLALQRLDRLDDAIRWYRQALQLDPAYADANCSLGNALISKEKLDEAVAYLQRALQINDNFPEAHNALGTALVHLDKLDAAIGCFQNALKLMPIFPEAHSNLGNALLSQNKLEEAGRCLQEALLQKPDFASAHWNLSFLTLLRGDFEHGWPEYEWRWLLPGVARRAFSQPLWDGSPLNGRTILLHAEQGLGDTIQFIRYAPLVKERGGKVLIECQPSLVPLLASAPGIDRLLPRGSASPPFNVQAPLLSLPGIFRTTLANIPNSVPYLQSEVRSPMSDVKTASSDIGHRTSDIGHVFRIGIAWQGSTTYRFYRQRAIPLMHFAKLCEVPGVQLISLQKGERSEELPALAARFPVQDLGNRLDEGTGAFMETAAVMMGLDLVISADTAVPHLAGALGCPVWIALPLVPDWRWMLERNDSHWYPTMRLFRQTRYGQWADVFDRMAEELKRATDETRIKHG
jgi:tetratricopeptide (TPR) repeat protein